MADFEKKYMKNLKELGVNLWYRYVDDVFATLSVPGKEAEILSFLNNRHPNVKFTV